jgi:hypothetical protein
VYRIQRDDTEVAPDAAVGIAVSLDPPCDRRCEFWVLELHHLDRLDQTRRAVDAFLASRSLSLSA